MGQGIAKRAKLAAGILAVLLTACGSKTVVEPVSVWVPPRVDLAAYRAIGMVEFASNQPGGLPRLTSERFLATLQSSQPGVRVIELGPEAQVLQAIGRGALDFQAVKEIGAKYGVDAVVTGRLELSQMKPKLKLANPLASMNLRADVEAALVARVLETGTGATLWTGSSNGSAPVASASLNQLGRGALSAGNPDDAYGALVQDLVYEITGDFRGYYERR
jgi:hypothetical protein